MIWIVLTILAGVGGLVYSMQGSASSKDESIADDGGVRDNEMGLPDISPWAQGGKYSKSYDEPFWEYAQKHKIPFALIKAHAIRESNLDHRGFRQEPSGKASFGLMQILWWPNSSRFKNWGYTDDQIGDGTLLYSAGPNVDIACYIIADNWNTWGNVRDMINAYNTGTKESKRVAPGNYVNDVLKHYSTLIKREVPT